jgi:APA family basic amino acid/polyamine antiporter
MAKKGQYYKLKKQIGLWPLVLYGVGIILGAGIYALLGVGAGVAGNAIWMSFVLGAFLAFFTGLSYAELSSMYQKDAAEYVYTENAFRKKQLSFLVQWIMLFVVIVSAATVALGFAGYFTHIFGGSPVVAAAGLIVVLSLLNYVGMKESTQFNVFSTLIETGGLIIVAALGFLYFGKTDVDFLALPASGINSVIMGTGVIFFAYIGFEEMVNFSEETKNAAKIVPKALVIALVISTILYILVSLSAVAIVGADALAASKAPLTTVVEAVIPEAAFVFSLIALFATANTVLISLIVASRMLYGLSMNISLPRSLACVGKRCTPYVSIFAVMLVSLFFLAAAGIKTIAQLTDLGIFIVYIFVNLSLIKLRYAQPKAKRLFRTPLNIGKFPVLPVLGILTSAGLILYFESELLIYELVVVLIGFAIYEIYKRINGGKSREELPEKKARKQR